MSQDVQLMDREFLIAAVLTVRSLSQSRESALSLRLLIMNMVMLFTAYQPNPSRFLPGCSELARQHLCRGQVHSLAIAEASLDWP